VPEKEILYEKENNIGIITLNRPDRLNAVTQEMRMRLMEIIREVIYDDEVRAVILTGNGRAFCSGTDVSNLGRTPEEEAIIQEQRRVMAKSITLPDAYPLPDWTFTRIPKPTIAAVNGAAVGMGAEWVVQCDIRIASENARFGWVFPLRGLCPDYGSGPYLLPYIVGLSKALYLLYSGDIIDAHEAARIGLADKVVPAEQLMSAAKEMAHRLIRGAPLAVKAVKELVYGSLEWTPKVHLDQTRVRFRSLNQTEDCREGIRAFLEKRAPVWKGT
jgi:enoyl-CoA hydratase/carnithine racemase